MGVITFRYRLGIRWAGCTGFFYRDGYLAARLVLGLFEGEMEEGEAYEIA